MEELDGSSSETMGGKAGFFALAGNDGVTFFGLREDRGDLERDLDREDLLDPEEEGLRRRLPAVTLASTGSFLTTGLAGSFAKPPRRF